ncbi:MAG TPA: hypothetical protein VE842_17380, partial [Pyrinomonadaceae bacterium]|nr:hypothetical protein [Pyrinomonadaceae bacterium]
MTALTMSGEEGDYIGGPGDYIYKTPSATLSVSYANDNTGDGLVDSIGFNVMQNSPEYSHWWFVEFNTGGLNKNLVPGYYPNAQRAPFA